MDRGGPVPRFSAIAMDLLTNVVSSDWFLVGLLVGIVMGLVARLDWIPSGGAVAVAAGAASVYLDHAPWWVLVGIAGVALREVWAGEGGMREGLGQALAGAGLVVVAAGVFPRSLAFPVVVVTLAVVFLLLERTSDDGRLGGVLWLMTLFGIYSTVPQTDPAVIALAACAGVALLVGLRIQGTAGMAAAVVLACAGGVGRTASLIGAVGCLGVLLLPGLARRPWWLRLLVHAAIVLLSARVAGLGVNMWAAVGIVLGTLAVALAVERVVD